ncbi:unnamed protein product [Wuchereria bancrofti]|uniref:Uncharacterized protein n=1 Tax=Wuchereria bancrofti TaxID=6293 RepID=A0A3P7EE84_WUCBA|nr:unnamed protein product [Wuchereria bancrofti]
MKIVPVQSVKPIATTISATMKAAITTPKAKESPGDISREISNITERQSGNMEKKIYYNKMLNYSKIYSLINETHISKQPLLLRLRFSAGSTTFYCNNVKKISVSSTIPSPFCPNNL